MSNRYSQKGMTIVELIIALSIATVILLVMSSFQTNVLRNTKYSQDSLITGQDARIILRTMTKEMRSASPGNNGTYPIAQAATSSIIFYSDNNNDGLKEQIRYFLASTTLKRGIIKPTGSPLTYVASNEVITILASNIKNATSSAMFEYFPSNYDGTTAALTQPVTTTSVRLIRINLTLDADPNRSPVPTTYTSQVTLRNLKDNL